MKIKKSKKCLDPDCDGERYVYDKYKIICKICGIDSEVGMYGEVELV
ncbi:hypothetical protein HOE07_04225 [archaeon]|jgi:hypothetical protein|nr:hypothetical protein [archaeon]